MSKNEAEEDPEHAIRRQGGSGSADGRVDDSRTHGEFQTPGLLGLRAARLWNGGDAWSDGDGRDAKWEACRAHGCLSCRSPAIRRKALKKNHGIAVFLKLPFTGTVYFLK